MQRAEDWRITLRAEPQVARVLLRRLIGPLVLHDESEMPEFIRADAVIKPALSTASRRTRHTTGCFRRGTVGEMYIQKWRP